MGQFNVLPLPLVHFIVAGHFVMLSLLAAKLWADSHTPPPLHNAPLDRHLSFQSKNFRLQRNIYLTALALVCWWMLATVYSLKKQIRDLVHGAEAKKELKTGEKGKAGDYTGIGPNQVPEPSAPPMEEVKNNQSSAAAADQPKKQK